MSRQTARVGAIAGATLLVACLGCGLVILNEPPAVAPTTRPAGVAIPACERAEHQQSPAYGEKFIGPEEPEAVTKCPPEYPVLAREKNIDGTVVMSVLVCEHGRVMDVKVTRSVAILDAAAVTALSCWRFEPAKLDGRPVPVWITVPMKFTLN